MQNNAIYQANLSEAPAILTLLNAAYRGNSAKQGWTHEADLISGDQRTTLQEIEGLLQDENSTFLVHKTDGKINGCVNLQTKENKIYLGMLSVLPTLQNAGIGKKLLNAAEEHALANNLSAIYMTVISERTELIDWYKRHGYIDTGKLIPFAEDGISGKHIKPLSFLVLEKTLQAAEIFECKTFEELSNNDLFDILQLRSLVFVVEQNCVYLDQDGKDQKSHHLFINKNNAIVAYARLLPQGVSFTEASIGRVVTHPDHRAEGLGKRLMEKAIQLTKELFATNTIRIGAQLYLKNFYQSLGFHQVSDIYDEDGIEHIEMIYQNQKNEGTES